MKIFKNIIVLAFAIVYLLVSTGMNIVHTLCDCSETICCSEPAEEENVVVQVNAGSCCCSESGNETTSNSSGEKQTCDCSNPVITFVKLGDQHGEQITHVAGQNIFVFALYYLDIEKISPDDSGEESISLSNYSPPENTYSGRFLINYLNQRKIPAIA